jgi:DNA polymerase-3 subunit epsilon
VDVAELRAWIASKPPKRGPAPRAYVTPRETRLALPDAPGVYRFLSRSGRVLYVGKATSLRERVNSYFRSRQNTRRKLAELMAQVHDLRVTEVATDVEAALLETDEIKALLPPYNVALRGQKSAPIFCTRDFSDATARPGRHFPLGPFASVDVFDEVHALVRALETGEGGYGLFWGMVDEAIVAAGLDAFRRRHGIRSAVSPPELLAVGAAKLAWDAEAAEAAPIAEAEAEAGEGAERVWDAEEVADSLERRLAGFVRNVRRARWRCRLTDATVTWMVPGRGRRCLVLESARVVQARWLDPGEPEPVPPGWRRPLAERQGLVVGESFDRMRVALTEIRRIAALGETTLRLGPEKRRVLDGAALVRVLGSAG